MTATRLCACCPVLCFVLEQFWRRRDPTPDTQENEFGRLERLKDDILGILEGVALETLVDQAPRLRVW